MFIHAGTLMGNPDEKILVSQVAASIQRTSFYMFNHEVLHFDNIFSKSHWNPTRVFHSRYKRELNRKKAYIYFLITLNLGKKRFIGL